MESYYAFACLFIVYAQGSMHSGSKFRRFVSHQILFCIFAGVLLVKSYIMHI